MTRLVVGLVSLYVVENRGVRCLAAWLRRHGVRVVEIYLADWTNNRLDPPSEVEIGHLLEVLRAEGVGLVGISVRASAYHRTAADITRQVRDAVGIPVLWGGLHPTSVPEDCIAEADHVCVGEGEGTTLALVRALEEGRSPAGIPGLWTRTPEGVVAGPLRPLEADVDSLPFPDYHSAGKYAIRDGRLRRGDPYLRSPLLQLSASIGCPFASCTFCGNAVLRRILAPAGPYYRARSPARVIEEITYARRYFRSLRTIRFEDGVFGADRAWVRDFAARYRAEVGLPFSCMADPRVVDAEWIRLLADAGLHEVFMGIQNTERVNRILYNRPIPDRRIVEVAETLHQHRIRASYHVVLDDPESTPADRRALLELLLRLPRPYNLFLFSMTVFPRSPLADDLLARGLITEDEVEGKATKVFQQWRVSMDHGRPAEEAFWAALLVLAPRTWIPRPALRALAESPRLEADPGPLVQVAKAVNLVKMPLLALDMLRRGEVDRSVIRRWLSRPGGWVTA